MTEASRSSRELDYEGKSLMGRRHREAKALAINTRAESAIACFPLLKGQFVCNPAQVALLRRAAGPDSAHVQDVAA